MSSVRVFSAFLSVARIWNRTSTHASPKSPLWHLRALSLIAVSLLATGCDPVQFNRTVKYGIGTELYSPAMARDTANLQAYLGYLCVQAGLDLVPSATGPACFEPMTPSQWTLLVATGWNDIDGRCDAYLAWLDSQRRQRLFVNQQMSHIRTLTSGIFAAVQAGVDTVNIVGVALGFVQDTYNSYNNQILYEIEGSTVETIVISRRLAFREAFRDVIIGSKPDAVRTLRDYLRVCTPYAIRMSVNTYSRARVNNSIPIEMEEAQILRESLISSTIRDVNAPLRPAPRIQVRPPPPPDSDLAPPVGELEGRLLDRDIKRFQAVVCLPQDGRFTIDTKSALLSYLRSNNLKDSALPEGITISDRNRLLRAFDAGPKCP
jgi:hypothetical protein